MVAKNNKRRFVGVICALFVSSCLLSLSAFADSLVPETGQTRCFNTLGAEISCSGTGQDGDLRAGIKWPTPRLTDNGDGTVTDHLTRLVWVKSVLCFETGDWSVALAHANALAAGQCGLVDGSVAGDWRLPNIRELSSLTDYGENAPALPAGHPFLPAGVQNPTLWSSTTSAHDPTEAWRLILGTGGISTNDKITVSNTYAWAVRDAPPPPTQCSDCVDSDGDGVDDNVDFCPDNTLFTESVPTVSLKPNHWALIDGDSVFDTVIKGNGKGPNRSYTIEDTAGCSCEQIIVEQGLGDGHAMHGCSISAMDDWVEFVNQ